MVQKGELIAEGRTAEIYAWGEGQVLKLYRPGWTAQTAEYEYQKALASQQTGYQVPHVGELVEVEGRPGITYQRVDGGSMFLALRNNPRKIPAYIRQWASLHADMHTRPAEGLPTIHEMLSYKIERATRLSERTRQAVLTHLESLPRDDKLLHGDFHPDNILLTSQGPIIIDWIDAAMGHPLADVARSALLATVGIPPGEPIRLVMGWMRAIYLRQYFRLSPYQRNQMAAWMLPVAAGRMQENIPHEQDALTKMVSRLLAKLT